MKEPNWKTCSEYELWEYVAWFLGKEGINTVLVGGAVVSVYTEGAYSSGDLDIVLESYQISRTQIEGALAKINFHKTGTRNFYKHPQCDHIFLEFLSPPVAIGEDYRINPERIEVEEIIIKILSPTDCIKDRLASFIYFNARECLEQAVLVAKAQLYSLEMVKQWCTNEGEKGIEAFEEFKELLK